MHFFKKVKWVVISLAVLLVSGVGMVYFTEPEFAYIPSKDKVLNGGSIERFTTMSADKKRSFDYWGISISELEASELSKYEQGQEILSAENGAVNINEDLLNLGRESFYSETYGNEVFLTDIMGLVDGPLTIKNVSKAVLNLNGKGTTNLRVQLAESIKIGNKTYKKGDYIDTGLDVPKGSYSPLGMPIAFSDGRIKAGVSCAACHATVDRETKMVIEGAPNADLNAGLLLAMATNSAAYFTHSDIKSLEGYLKEDSLKVEDTNGKIQSLPDPVAFEKAVDEIFAQWAPGNFDSTIDMENNPSQIPDSFTLGDHPYGWSGFAMAGPFNGLSTFSNNVHAQNTDSTSQAEVSEALFGIDKEVYLGTLLQNAADPTYRFNPKQTKKPSEFFAKIDPTPSAPGVNELVKTPQFPKVSLIAPDGLIASSPGFGVNEQNNAMSAWQNTLVPPKSKTTISMETLDRGREVFKKAGCISCHAGGAGTNNQVISAKVIGTEPSRAKAFKKTEKIFGNSYVQSPDTPVPVPEDANILKVPTDYLDRKDIKLAYAHGDSPGGYKVKGLVGLYWTAPYLHDGGVAVGPNGKTDIGVSATLLKGIPADPKNSLKALVDKKLREKVVKANKASKQLQQNHTVGSGHNYWVDETTGFTKEDQEALVQYLMLFSE
jgi:cytochrome c551/c552